MKTLDAILREHPFFKDLKDEYLKLIVGCGVNTVFKKGELILKEGDAADYFYLIKSGLIAIEIPTGKSEPITIQTLGTNEILGWSWLIPPHENRFNCRTLQDSRAIALDGKCLREKCEENHDLGYDLLIRLTKVFTQRLEATRLQLLNISEG